MEESFFVRTSVTQRVEESCGTPRLIRVLEKEIIMIKKKDKIIFIIRLNLELIQTWVNFTLRFIL